MGLSEVTLPASLSFGRVLCPWLACLAFKSDWMTNGGKGLNTMKSTEGTCEVCFITELFPKGRTGRLSHSKGVEGGHTAFYLKKLHDKNQRKAGKEN